MKDVFIELLTDKLENFVNEVRNDKQKRSDGDVIGFENVQLKYYKGYLDGMCCALNCSYGKEGDYWVIRDGRRHIIAKKLEAYDD